MTTTPIFDQVRAAWPARTSDPVTSHDAVPDKPSCDLVRSRVLRILTNQGPMTHDEIHDWYVLAHGPTSGQNIRTRTRELWDRGGVRAADRDGRTATGRRALRWDIHREEQS